MTRIKAKDIDITHPTGRNVDDLSNDRCYNKGEHPVLKAHQGRGLRMRDFLRSPSQWVVKVIFSSAHPFPLPLSPLCSLTTTLLCSALPAPAPAWSAPCLCGPQQSILLFSRLLSGTQSPDLQSWTHIFVSTPGSIWASASDKNKRNQLSHEIHPCED